MIIRNVSGTPIILKDLTKEGNDVVKIISNAKETELKTLRNTNNTTWNPFSVNPIFCGI
jgi:hypothetical protein